MLIERVAAEETHDLRRRVLRDGRRYRVLKNFPTRAELLSLLEARATRIRYAEWTHYWLLSYRVRR